MEKENPTATQEQIYALAGAVSNIVSVAIEIESVSGEMLDSMKTVIEILEQIGDPRNELENLADLLAEAKLEIGEQIMDKKFICPECDGPIPNAKDVGKYAGAISRKDNKTEICSNCGVREALEDFYKQTEGK